MLGYFARSIAMTWLVPDLPAGEHTFQIEVSRSSGASTCFTLGSQGNTQESFLLVEELP